MGQVLIRNLDDALIADYKRSAVAHGRSLEAELRAALASARPARRSTRDELIALSAAARAKTANLRGSVPGWLLIREDRDR